MPVPGGPERDIVSLCQQVAEGKERVREHAITGVVRLGRTITRRSGRIAVAVVVATVATFSVAAPVAAAADISGEPVTLAKPGPTKPTGPDSVGTQSVLSTHVTSTGVNIRPCASTSCPSVGKANPTDSLLSFCYRGGDSINGNPHWDVIFDQDTGIGGFVTEYYLTNTSQSDHCAMLEGGLVTGATQSGVNMRACASTSCTIIGRATSETLLSVCYTLGTSVNGNPYWDLVYAAGSGRAGFITEYYLLNQSQSTYCG